MTDTSSKNDLIEQLGDEYVERRRRGEQPNISEYCAKHPDQAEEIRDWLGTIELMEDFPSAADTANSASREYHLDVDEIGGYRIVSEIGRGGMGVVYEAEHLALKRRVALKVLPQPSSLSGSSHSDKARLRFEREARSAAKMHHTNIVPVFEVGRQGDYFFYAMQLIHGRSLDRVIAELKNADRKSQVENLNRRLSQPSDPSPGQPASASGRGITLSTPKDASSGSTGSRHFHRSVARIGWQATEALAYAHARGVVHRDIKPSNLLLDSDGVVWVTDFGLAKTDEEGLTQSGDFLGTLRYMSPERFKGECDARADVYAIGLTLYELLVHRPAFESSDRLTLIDTIHKTDPRTPRSLDRLIPQDLETIVLKAIEKDPDSRYASAKALAHDLQRFIDDLPIRARRASAAERFLRWSRRNKRLAAALSAVALLLVLIACGTTMTSIYANRLRRKAETAMVDSAMSQRRAEGEKHKAEIAQHQAEEAQRDAEAARLTAEKRREEIKRNLYFAEMNLASHAASELYGSETIKARLADWDPKTVGEDLRGWEWYYLYALSHRARYVSPPQRHWTWSVDYSPDGKQLANVVNGFGIQVRDAETGRVVREKFLGSGRFVDWSPNGKRIAVAHFGGTISVCDAQTLEPLAQATINLDREVVCVNWSADSKRLAYSWRTLSKEEFVVGVWDVGSRKVVRTLRGPSENITDVRWSPDGTHLAATADDGFARIWDGATGELVAQFDRAGRGLCWSPDSTKLACGGDVRVWDVAAKKEIASGSQIGAFSVCWRPGQNQLACGCGDGAVRLWDVALQNTLRTFHGHTGEVRSVAVHPEGRQICSSGLDRTVRIWDIDAADQTQLLHTTGGRVDKIDWSDDGRRLVSATHYGQSVEVWDTASGARLNVHRGDVNLKAVEWSPDNQRAAFGGHVESVLVYNISSGTVAPLEGKVNWVNDLSWSRHGRLAAGTDKGKVVIWDEQGQRIDDLDNRHEGFVQSVVWRPDGGRLATTGADNFVRVWNVDEGKMIWEQKRESLEIRRVRWSRDDDLLATCHRGAVIVWDGATGQQWKVLDEVRENFNTADFSPDGLRLATGSDASVSVWDIASRRVAIKIPTDRKPVHCVRWSPDGKRLAAGCWHAIRIWDATRGYEED